MQHPIIARANAKVRYDQLVKEADDYRLTKTLTNNKPGIVTQIVSSLSGLLKSLNNETVHSTTSSTTV
jgi:hypothetical protein